MKHTIRRLMALLLALSMSMGLLSAAAWAGEESGDPEEALSLVETENADTVNDEESEKTEENEPEEEPTDRGEDTQPEEAPEEAQDPNARKAAQETPVECSKETAYCTPPEVGSGEEDLLLGYLEQQARGDSLTTQSEPGSRGKRLTGVDAAVYGKLADGVAQIAAGDRASTEFTIPIAELGLPQTSWTAAELGVSAITEQVDGNLRLTQEAQEAASAKVNFDLNHVLWTLMADFPYECYWYNKTAFTIWSRNCRYQGSYDSTREGWVISLEGNITVSMPVLSDYAAQGETYRVNTQLAKTACQAATQAAALVEQYKNQSDSEKLDGYRQEICNRVTYNQDAADGTVDSGNPWQLIWVFDDDPDTNVVCEGYSKAFQFLCELSSFQGTVHCRSVSGEMSTQIGGKNQSGAHMWNIVECNGGKNYLVDVTNCDGNSIGAPKQLFLATAASGSIAGGYDYSCSNAVVRYTYDESTLFLYDEEELTMQTGESVSKATGTCGGNLTWRLDDAGALTITGTGMMDDYGDSDSQPWKEYRDQITMAALESGVTCIGAGAFSGCTSLSSIVIPSSVTSIGANAFGGVGQLTAVVDCGSYGETYCNGAHIPISALHHHLSKTDAKNATCTEDGNNEYWTCSECRKQFSDADGNTEMSQESIVIKSKGHTLTRIEAKAATCTENGNIEYWTCGTCHKLFKDAGGNQEIADKEIPIDPNNHVGDTEIRNSKAATCGAAGYTGDTWCKGCGTKLSNGRTIPATGNHSWDAGVVTMQPTTTAEGVKTYTCKVCHQTKTEKIARLVQTPSQPQPTLSATKGLKVKVKKTTATVTWKKNTKGSGYQIQYSMDPTFASGVKTKKVKKNKTLKVTIKKLTKNKTYYFRIRTIKGGEFSAWSAVKKVKVKK